jgi:hypothetical protein
VSIEMASYHVTAAFNESLEGMEKTGLKSTVFPYGFTGGAAGDYG